MLNQSRSAIDLLLADSLKELARIHPIEKITIREITDKAGVIRPTFYNHFQDKYELIEWIVDQEIYQSMVSYFDKGLTEEGMISALDAIQADDLFYTRVSIVDGQNSLDVILRNMIKKMIIRYADLQEMQSHLPYSWMTVDQVADAYAQSVGYAIIVWIHAGMNAPKDELVKTVIFLMTHSPYDVVNGKITT